MGMAFTHGPLHRKMTGKYEHMKLIMFLAAFCLWPAMLNKTRRRRHIRPARPAFLSREKKSGKS